MLNTLTMGLSPYIIWVKVGVAILILSLFFGVVWYIRSVFIERGELLLERGKLQLEVTIEKQKNVVAMEQLRIWQDTVAKMNAAVKNIKIQSDTYIQGIDNEKAPEFNGRSSIPLIMSVPSNSMPRHADYSSGRVCSTITPR